VPRQSPLQGIHWVNGIELGLRLLAFVWVRRLLAAYPGVSDRFENNATFRRQLHAHQTRIAAFYSRGSSANNHLIAEMAGLFAAAQAFPIFPESADWAAEARTLLERESEGQTFPDGLNRELASDYHVFALELFRVAGVEADAAGKPFSDGYWCWIAASWRQRWTPVSALHARTTATRDALLYLTARTAIPLAFCFNPAAVSWARRRGGLARRRAVLAPHCFPQSHSPMTILPCPACRHGRVYLPPQA
jgi:hypothetical protein